MGSAVEQLKQAATLQGLQATWLQAVAQIAALLTTNVQAMLHSMQHTITLCSTGGAAAGLLPSAFWFVH
jgi:hypothetical protein